MNRSTQVSANQVSANQVKAKPFWWIPTLLVAGIIWFFSSKSGTPVPTPHPLDWIAHFSIYLALGFCLGRATGRRELGWILAAWFGALDEVHQAFVPPREAGIADWWFDLLGSGVGAWLAVKLAPAPRQGHQIDLDFEDNQPQ